MEPKTPATTDKQLLIIGGGSVLLLLGIVMWSNASAVRAMRRTAGDLDAIIDKLIENSNNHSAGRPDPSIPPSPPAGRPAEPTAVDQEAAAAAARANGARPPAAPGTQAPKAGSDDASPQP